ncbi:hypothetical protein LZ023_32490 [Pseudomonas silvicola]|nr:hypothetical protein LZ023_32490 [Pseudomonas silvicola]
MRWLVFVFLVVWIHLGDLGTAWLYHGGAWPQAGHLRNLRDVLAIAIAGLCLVSVRLPTRLLVPVLAYGILALAYLVLDRSATTSGILLGSFGTLLIPMLFFLVGFYCVRDPARLHRYGGLLATLAVASTRWRRWKARCGCMPGALNAWPRRRCAPRPRPPSWPWTTGSNAWAGACATA